MADESPINDSRVLKDWGCEGFERDGRKALEIIRYDKVDIQSILSMQLSAQKQIGRQVVPVIAKSR